MRYVRVICMQFDLFLFGSIYFCRFDIKMNDFRFICARLILYKRVLKILSAPAQPTLKVVHYIPHQAVVREHAETTKMRIVYDCSSRANAHSPSLNDCLETGPPLQPLLFDILLRNWMRSIVSLGIFRRSSFESECTSKTETQSRSSGSIT